MAGKARIFQNETGDTGAIHSIGNGSIIGYGQGPNIVSVYAPYTSPNHFTLKVESDGRTWETSREPHTDIHHHHAGEGCDRIHMLDYCHTDYPCLIREIRCAETFSLELCFPGITDSHMSGLFADAGYQCITYVVKGGNPIIFHTSHTPFTGHVLISRACSSIAEIGANRWRITCSPGETMLLASGAEDAGTVILGLREIVGSGLEGIQVDRDVCVHANAPAGPLTASHLKDRRVFWKRYAARRNTAGEPDYVDAAIVCIKTQQSVQGGLPSCRELQYGYSRDNYGPSRAFLALGYHEDARKVLDFRFNKWRIFGGLRNAEGMGCFEPRHFSENEEVEQTSYTVLSARDYWQATKDDTYIHMVFPMLLWCLQVQIPYLHHDMLPFNGDETYIAGGLLGRSAVNHGSAESTLMFIEGALWLSGWAVRNGRTREVFGLEAAAFKAKAVYRRNFLSEGKLLANNPRRMDADMPCLSANRGVCAQADYVSGHRFGHEAFYVGLLLHDGKGHFVRDMELPSGGYRGEAEPAKEIGQVLVTPAWFRSALFNDAEMLRMARSFMRMDRENLVVAGHEPAMLLYALCRHGGTKEEITEARNLVRAYANENGSWDEYYRNGHTITVRHRPWETGYSLEALLLSESFLA